MSHEKQWIYNEVVKVGDTIKTNSGGAATVMSIRGEDFIFQYTDTGIEDMYRMKRGGYYVMAKVKTPKPKGNVMKKFKLKDVKHLTKKQQKSLEYLSNIEERLGLLYLGSLNGIKSEDSIIRRSLRNFEKRGAFKPKFGSKNKYLELFNNIKNVQGQHVPFDNKHGEWIGVEIECFIPMKSLDMPIIERGCGECDYCENEEYNECPNSDEEMSSSHNQAWRNLRDILKKSEVRNVSAKSDGSIECDEDEYLPVEFTCLFTRNNPRSLSHLCSLLNSLNAEVNKSCGLHVHLDQRDVYDPSIEDKNKEVMNRGKRLENTLHLLQFLVPKSRRNNSYCQLKMSTIKGADRYSAVNMTALMRFKTIEVRLHSATTDFHKINNWVNLLYDITRSEDLERPKMKPSSLDALFNFLHGKYMKSLKEKLMSEYFKARYEKFNNDTVEEESGETGAA